MAVQHGGLYGRGSILSIDTNNIIYNISLMKTYNWKSCYSLAIFCQKNPRKNWTFKSEHREKLMVEWILRNIHGPKSLSNFKSSQVKNGFMSIVENAEGDVWSHGGEYLHFLSLTCYYNRAHLHINMHALHTKAHMHRVKARSLVRGSCWWLFFFVSQGTNIARGIKLITILTVLLCSLLCHSGTPKTASKYQ